MTARTSDRFLDASGDSRVASWSRRDLFKVAGLGAVAVVAAGCSSGEGPTPRATISYHTEPGWKVPKITVETSGEGLADGYVLLTKNGPLMVDNAGNVVWYKQILNQATTNLELQQYRGSPVLTWWQGRLEALSGALVGQGEGVIVDGSYKEIARIRAGAGLKADLHELTLTPEGTALIPCYETHPADLTSVGGPAKGSLVDCHVQEIDIASGRLLFDWKASDHIDLTESYSPFKTVPYDFIHLNSIGLEPDGNLLVSGRHTWAVYEVDRSSGEVLWRLGGKKSDYKMEPGSVFAWQHHVRRQPNGTITVFDDETKPAPLSYSRGLILSLDDSAKTARVAAEYPQPKHLATPSQGSMEVLPNGNAFVGWGAEPFYTEFDVNGKVLLDAQISGDSGSYRAFLEEWTGQPSDAPKLAVTASGKSATAYASWNGATEVAFWKLRAGADKNSLSEVVSAPKSGFETPIRFSAQGGYAAVDALDSSGTLLGRSAPVKL